jgi:hypothetical protein
MSGPPPPAAPIGRTPGMGPGWARVARAVAEQVHPAEIDGIWVFSPVRREDREWGTAVVSSRSDGGRRRVFTGSYVLVVRGRERGQGKAGVEEVGESPPDVLYDVIAGVQERAGETEPPVPIPPEAWFTEEELVPPPVSMAEGAESLHSGDGDHHSEIETGD